MKLYLIILPAVLIFTLPVVLRPFVPVPFSNESILLVYYPVYFLLIPVSFIAAVAFFVLRKKKPLFKKFYIVSLLSFFILPAAFAAGMTAKKFALKDLPYGSNYMQFNSAVWKDARHTTSEVRQKMLKDLLTNVLPGKNRAETENLLGIHDRIYDGAVFYVTGENRKSLLGVDMELLEINFDENGLFKGYAVT